MWRNAAPEMAPKSHTAGLNGFSHTITFGLNLAIFTNLCQFVYAGTKSKRRNITPHLKKWGPFYCVVLATVGVMADLTRHVLLDSNNWFMTDPNTGKVVKFHFDDCAYEVEKVRGVTDGCPDVGVGPLFVTEENALGVDAPMYNPDGSYSVYGIWLTLFATWAGFILMFVGIAWYTDLPRKIAQQCREIFGSSPVHVIVNGHYSEISSLV
ncbi:hypothetical protein FOZ60_003695 [Perkinsus olseni]|uniref:Uncharacterized protein n=1 Tax=Perkinsus olseni TaxID=32597 RepID=A0A7J6PHK1_PEROL|nr:hypothetical protein FOZ60_003695 [Perkinsus olseni]